MFVLNHWLRELILYTFANRLELRCEPKRLMLLYYKICPCYPDHDFISHYLFSSLHFSSKVGGTTFVSGVSRKRNHESFLKVSGVVQSTPQMLIE